MADAIREHAGKAGVDLPPSDGRRDGAASRRFLRRGERRGAHRRQRGRGAGRADESTMTSSGATPRATRDALHPPGQRRRSGLAGKELPRAEFVAARAPPVPAASELCARHRPRPRPRHRRRDDGLHGRRCRRAAAAALPAPDRLVTLWDTNIEKGLAHDPISPVNFMDYRALPGLQRTRRRGGGPAQPVDPDSIRCASTPSRSAATSSRCLACAAARRGFPERAVLRAQRTRRGDQRPPLAVTRYNADPFDHRPAALAERHAVHRRRHHAAEVSLTRTTSMCGSGCGGI